MRGLSNFRKRRTIFLWCRKRKLDLVFLQETHSIAATENQGRNEWGAETISCHGSSNSRAVAILFKNGIDCAISHKIADPEGRYIILKACIQDKDFVLINVYAPNKDKDQVNFCNNLLSILQNENLDSVDDIILGGDLNCPLDPLLDKKGGASTKRKSVISCVDDFKSKLDLIDIWRSKNPDAKSFTWSQKSPPVFCRLDYWLISNNLSDFVELTEIIPAVRTDHDAISLELGKLENELKGPGNWKMNCSLLDDEEYEEDIATLFPLWTADGQKELTDDRMIWDWIKYNIRAHAIQYSKRKAKELELQEKLSRAKSKLEKNPNDHDITYYNVLQGRLESFYEEKTKGVIIRARAKWHEHGEKSTKYFLNLQEKEPR